MSAISNSYVFEKIGEAFSRAAEHPKVPNRPVDYSENLFSFTP
jgi:hypothetical protein